jgi:hypothetical protein
MKAVAIKKDQTRDKATADFQEMGILRCDGCGEEFIISHHPAVADKWVASQQAHWLEKVLAEEHERDKKHSDRIELPGRSGRAARQQPNDLRVVRFVSLATNK